MKEIPLDTVNRINSKFKVVQVLDTVDGQYFRYMGRTWIRNNVGFISCVFNKKHVVEEIFDHMDKYAIIKK